MTRRYLLIGAVLSLLFGGAKAQTIKLSTNAKGKQFDGIGAVNGGGATSVLLKDYPEPQRSQIMDLVFKPMFGASVSAMLVEVPGDGNSTQGSMPSHSHYRGDNNFMRGYIWWVMREAHQRNPQLALDATAWSSPAWVGSCWSDDMVDYYIAWMQGLRQVHGMELDALGCHNERGWNGDFAKKMRKYNKKRPILLVCNPRGGTSILEWAPGQHYFTEAVRRCKQGMAYGELKGILWHQGCADSRQRCDVYPDLLSEMVDSLRSELGVGDKVPFIVGELAHWRKTSAAFNEMLHGIPDRIPNSGWVSAEGCTPLKDERDPHFSRDGQILLGIRYAEKMHEMQK
jgi:hypothetical protein